MKPFSENNFCSIAMVFSVAMFFFSCADNYKRIGEEAQVLIYPQGVAENFTFTYTETIDQVGSEASGDSRIVAILTSPISEDFDNMRFQYRTFPKGLKVEYFDKDNNKSTVTADYGIFYSGTNLLDLRDNVVIETHDGKKLETPQLYWDRSGDWIFTQEKFKFTNPEEGTIMDGEGMDFRRDLNFFNAHKTYGLMTLKEDAS